MATKSPWVKFYPSQFLKELEGFKPAETAVYTTLVLLMIDKGAPIFNNASQLTNLCGCSVQTFRKILEALIRCGRIIRLEDGRLWHTSSAFDLDTNSETSNTVRQNEKREGESYVS
ncbi:MULTISPECIES: DUF1376 domain-containing protein [unclassified Bartonella]|uniref:DUF1376 domain-containing protein n=1 Tax=unclassified Bartonella TaxID=2645622 RepID=UPI00099944A9|nr:MULTISPECIES: DUF1376 domain-containing protein [unclassified Bartonella]AQX19682.1 Protein of unknown function (DUF1376) [Bartonella sp. WD16.2]OPB29543.1 Protein of unknown function (DUF1376) [Bartonella sp. WD12.1]